MAKHSLDAPFSDQDWSLVIEAMRGATELGNLRWSTCEQGRSRRSGCGTAFTARVLGHSIYRIVADSDVDERITRIRCDIWAHRPEWRSQDLECHGRERADGLADPLFAPLSALLRTARRSAASPRSRATEDLVAVLGPTSLGYPTPT
ncbi:hypothetical protein BFL35_02165 [Clavibacter michiganensis]|nr:hypothetical protein BFL35_02165 [Clavibacter michiganensis]